MYFVTVEARGRSGGLWLRFTCRSPLRPSDGEASVEVRLGPIAMPRLTLFALRYRGVDYLFNHARDLVRTNESRTDTKSSPADYFPPSRWIVGGGNDQLRFRGELWSELPQFIGARYADPDGSSLVAYHSLATSARLEVLAPDDAGWRVADKLTAENTGALEFAGREADPRLSIHL